MKKVIPVLFFMPFMALMPSVNLTSLTSVTGDVVITEIMADPFPEVSLPGEEYLEITNRTDKEFDLLNWKLRSGDQKYLFPASVIMPGQVIILCHEPDTSRFTEYGKVIGLKNFPALTDVGKIICLFNSADVLIHGIEYSGEWYHDVLKEEGGWSLEMIDIDFPFSGEANWRASSSRTGGSPGKENASAAFNPDTGFNGIENVYPEDSMNIVIRFSEPVLNSTEASMNSRVGDIPVKSFQQSDLLFTTFRLQPGESLKNGMIYEIEVAEGLTDFAGNSILKTTFRFGLPEDAVEGDVRFNEILFNPWPGDADYIELYNCSGKIVDVSRLHIIAVNDETNDTSGLYQLAGEKMCFLPHSYLAFSEENMKMTERYPAADADNFLRVEDLPSMPDDKGHLVLYSRELEKIDEVYYDDDMHYSLLSGQEGVSLEKKDPCSVSVFAGNWHSAAGSSGWGTPGSRNSVFSEYEAAGEEVVLSSSRMTPDNDGYEDILTVHSRFTGTGNVVSITIFDEAGNLVRRLVSRMLAGPEASFLWDGTADDGSPVGTGIYIVFVTMYDVSGKTGKWKKICSVLR